MNFSAFRSGLAAAFSMVVLLAGGAAHAQHPPAPSIAAYAALPAISRVSLSDDGSTLAYLRRQGGASEVIVQTVNGEVLAAIDVSDRRPVGVSWASPDHVLIRSLVFESQLTIGESLLPQLDIVNVRTKRVARALRSADRAVVNAVYDYWRGERGGRPVLYVQAMTTERNAWTPDIYRIDLDTGRGVLSSSGLRDTRGYLLGADGEVKLRIASDPETGRIRLSVPQGSGWREIYRRTDLLDGPNVWGFGPQGDTVMVSALEDGENVLLELGLADGSRRRRTDLPAAADQAIYDRTGRLLAIGAGGDSSQWVFFEPKLEAAFDLMHRGLPARQLTVVSYNSDYTKFVFYSEGAGEVGDAGTYYIYDAAARSVSVVGRAYPDIRGDQIAFQQAIRYSASDGLEIPAYLTLPPGKDARGLPLIVFPHGGPQSRDYLGFDWWAQAMAARGYAVLQPNFRGSDGLGQAFLEAGYGEWGRKMQTDLSDGVRFLAGRGIIDPEKVCIVGASYGGYAALAGPTLDPGVYRCAVSVAGVSDLRAMLTSETRLSGSGAESRNPIIRYWNRFMGGAGSGDRTLDERSPARQADRVDAPILLIHGRRDTVVPYEQSTIMADALRRAGKPVELIALDGEDHSLSQAETRLQMLEATIRFLEENNPPN
ncbi:MAG: alpha/beta hydrolase family protein [Brevundimonas aurantiaca]|uniref:alpha/beta hydrolase family protein n=1 Tax=Brevundimonas aurantiaca TaxID=74316 RepID=UPI001602C5D7|nr:S9 family peptidase [Brevundimonas aurantiaca]